LLRYHTPFYDVCQHFCVYGQSCCMCSICRLRRREEEERGHLALRQRACALCTPSLADSEYERHIGPKRYLLAPSALSLADSEYKRETERRRSEDTSRSGKGLAPSALPLLLTLSMSEKRTITPDNTHPHRLCISLHQKA
jgi:hypothetical protein